MEKYFTKNKCHTSKKMNLSIKHYSNKRNCMQSSSLNNITSIQKYNSRISVILIYYYALCKGSKCRRFDPGGSLDRRVKLSLRAPSQMGWREMEHKGGNRGSCYPAPEWMRLQ